MKAMTKGIAMNSFKRDFGEEGMDGREAMLSCITSIDNKFAGEVYVDYTTDGFDWLAKAVHDPKVYRTKDDGGLFHFYVHTDAVEYDGISVSRDLLPDAVEHIIVDYDTEKTMLEVAYEFRAYNIIMYSSGSNDATNKRFRLCIELEHRISRKTFTNSANRLKLREFFSGCDKTSFDWGRYFYLPCLLEDKSTVYGQVISITGKTLNPIDDIGLVPVAIEEDTDAVNEEFQRYAPTEIIKSFKRRTMPVGKRDELLDDAVALVNNLAPHLDERGSGFDVHDNLLTITRLVRAAGIEDSATWIMEQLDYALDGDIYDRVLIHKEVMRM